MSRLFYHVMQDNLGNLLFDVSGTMRVAGTGTLATIYGDEALTVVLPNPMTNHPSYGSFKCYLGAGGYDFYMAKSGYTFETLTGVQGHGTMAYQNANAVGITGGTIGGITNLQSLAGNIDSPTFVVDSGNHRVGVGTATPSTKFEVVGNALISSTVQILGTTAFGGGFSPSGQARNHMEFPHATQSALSFRPNDADTGPANTILFLNTGGAIAGSIGQTATVVSYNTSSDARMKHASEPLRGALDVVRALNPVAFLWKADGSRGYGFIAHEVQAVVPEAVTGMRDAVDEAGQMVPQGMDHSKLVPWLVSAVKELTQQVEILTAKLAAAGG